MERLIETDNVTFEYCPNRSEGEYRLSVFDKYGHYLDEIWLESVHVGDLIKMFENNKFDIKEESGIL